MNDAPVTFGKCLSGLMRKKNISIGQLTKVAGYRSRNSVVRILHDETSPDVMKRFFQLLIVPPRFSLSEDEISSLRDALYVSTVGVHTYNVWTKMAFLPKTEDHADKDPITDAALEEFLDLCGQIEQGDILLVNCCWEKVVRQITNRLGAARTDVNIDHYNYTGDHVGLSTSYIWTIMPLLRMRFYKPYRVDGTLIADELPGIIADNLAICRNNAPDGKLREAILRFDYKKTGHIEIIEQSARRGASDLIRTVIESYSQLYEPLRLDCFPYADVDKYIAFYRRLVELERDRAIYMLKPDLGFFDIPAEIIMRALTNGGAGAFSDSGVMNDLRDLHVARHRNIVQKRQATHTILSEQAMRRFIKTGLMSNHFFAMRPFSPAERVEILHTCLALEQSGSSHHIYFAKSDDLFNEMAFTGFGEIGLCIQNIRTSFPNSADHCASIITDARLTSSYCDYFKNMILRQCIRTPDETMTILQALYHEATRIQANQRALPVPDIFGTFPHLLRFLTERQRLCGVLARAHFLRPSFVSASLCFFGSCYPKTLPRSARRQGIMLIICSARSRRGTGIRSIKTVHERFK